jgi:polysaccharide export outer membrane protein
MKGLEPFFTEAPPLVTVDGIEIRSQMVHIMGAIPRPGAYPLSGPLTIVELLARAGGLNDFTKGTGIQVVRTQGLVVSTIPFNYESYQNGERLHSNITLRAGDIITVK